MKPIIIGLHGLPDSGKNTIGEYLVLEHDFQLIAFADPLKMMLMAGLGLDESHFESRAAKQTPVPWLGKTPRELTDTLGDWMRAHVGDRALIEIAAQQQAVLQREHGRNRFCFTDVRRNEEALLIRAQGGAIWNVVSPREYKPSGHPIHRSIDSLLIDDIFVNCGTEEDIGRWVDKRLERYRANA